MKIAVVLLLVVAAVQGRSTGVNKVVNSQSSLAAPGDSPWVVHIRLAVGTSGYLNSCIGSLIDARWVLTSAYCVRSSSYIWVRFGVVEVIRPERVLETTAVTRHSEYNPSTGQNNLALINLNREVELSDLIGVVALPAPNSNTVGGARYCAFGETENNGPGEWLSCWDVSVVVSNNVAIIAVGDGISSTEFDAGAPLVSDGALVGVINEVTEWGGPGQAEFTRVSSHVNWISGMTGISVGRAAPAQPDASEGLEVTFVN